ncbi:MAG TPA: MmgE/PrpD family protein [Burkholderiales bacterium]|nr:MmgE/PrpD family protein [Burkholderiales bacterium]
MKTPAVAEVLAGRAGALRAADIPPAIRGVCEDLLVDIAGLCVAARNTDYAVSLKKSLDAGGACTALGHAGGYAPGDAALLNGTAAHGEDFDDTFEGGPVHSGAVIVPAVLAACERFGRDGESALLGIAAGVETMCRLSLVAPKLIHKAGFHPTAVLGAMASTLAVSVALNLDQKQTVNALGISGSMAGGIIEYLAEGASTKRLHAGWAAHAGLHAVRAAREGFTGPRTVFEGAHGLFFAFARENKVRFEELTHGFGDEWRMGGLTFKPYATGTMNQPYIDCALRLRDCSLQLGERGFRAEDVAEVLCETAEGYVHRLWEPLAAKQRPANDYAAKFSTPFNVAVAFVTGGAGLDAFSERTVRDERILGLAGKVRYKVDPENPYPKRYTGHVKMTLRDGRVFEERQPHIRGGVHEPLSRGDIERKFHGNAAHGGWPAPLADQFLAFAREVFDGTPDLAPFRR